MKTTVMNKQVDAAALMLIKNHTGNVNRWKCKIRTKLKFNDSHTVNTLAENELYEQFNEKINCKKEELLKHHFEPSDVIP